MNYLLRRIDRTFWKSVRVKCAEDNVSLRAVILHCLQLYLDGKIRIRATR